MSSIASYVFLDLETSGLPEEECNKTKITELSLIAVKRSHILQTRPGESPRVQHKLTLCFNPWKVIHPTSTMVTGLCNDLLESETSFNINVYNTINNFLSLLTKPVCLIAHNGMNFDFPILKKHLDDIGVSFPDDLLWPDSLHAMYDILNERESQKLSPNGSFADKSSQEDIGVDEVDLMWQPNALDMQKQNETTPKKSTTSTDVMKTPRKELSKPYARVSKVRRKLYWITGPKPKDSYKLKDIYERLLKRPGICAHRAENDCLMTLECSVAISTEFVQWVDENNCRFADVKPMTAGVKLGC